MKDFILTFYLAGLSILGFLATDMYLPAFGLIQTDLNVSAGTVSASLSIYMAGFAFAQLFWGPMADRIGSKKVLLAGLLLFSIGCIGLTYAQSTIQIWIMRAIQAIGVCAASVSWQIIVLQNYHAHKARKMFATIMPLVALSPALAPLIGVWLLKHFDWRAIFIFLLIVAITLVILTLCLVEDKSSMNKNDTIITYREIFYSRLFSGNVIVFASCASGFFAWLTGSPFIIRNLGYGPDVIGFSYLPQTLTFLAGGFGFRALQHRMCLENILKILLVIYAVSVLWIVIAAYFLPSLLSLLLPFSIMSFADGAIYPLVVSRALTSFKEAAGKCAALKNATQLGCCFIASLVVSAFADDPLRPTVLIMLLTVLTAIVGYLLQRNQRK